MQLFGDAQRFLNFIFRGVAESDANGNATVDVKLPIIFLGKIEIICCGSFR